MYTQYSSVRGPTNSGQGDIGVNTIDVLVTAAGATAVGDLVALPVPTNFSIGTQTVGWPSTAACVAVSAANALTPETRRVLGVALTATSGATTLTVRIRGLVSAKVDSTTDIAAGDYLMGVAAAVHMVKGAVTATQAFFPAMALEARTDNTVGTITVLFDGLQGFGWSQEA
jgi:hypothetical protein